MAFEWDDERKEYVEVIKIANPEDLGIGTGGGGEADSVQWGNVLNKPQTFPPSAHDHNDIYYTKEESEEHVNFVRELMEQEQGKVATTAGDELGYLENKVDNITLSIQGNELKVLGVDGLTIGVADISEWLSGTSGNIQGQIDGINETLTTLTAGMHYLGKVETFADLQAVGNMENGNLVVVLADENRTGGRSMYVYSENVGAWDFIGEFTFTDKFIELTDTPGTYENGKYLKSTGSGIVYGDINYEDVLNKPSSTITQIDDAVSKRHEHSNKVDLDKLGVDEQGRLTIDGIPYIPADEKAEKQQLLAQRTGSNQSLTAGTGCIFNTKVYGEIPYNTSTGEFTLEAGKTYRVEVAGSILTTNWVSLELIDIETESRANSAGISIWTLPTQHEEVSAGPLKTYVTPETTRNYQVRVRSMFGTASLRTTYATLEVTEV